MKKNWHFNDYNGNYRYIPGCNTNDDEVIGKSFHTTPLSFDEDPMNKLNQY